MTAGAATTKIVIVAGQEFSVPAETDNEAIRAHLKTSGFPDVAAATIQAGTRTVDGQEVTTIEFVKRAGTKGLGSAELAELLTTVPPQPLDRTPRGLSGQGLRLLRQLVEDRLTVGAALADAETLFQALLECESRSVVISHEGDVLCGRIDRVSAVPCAIVSDW